MADSIRDINAEIKKLQEQLGETPNAKFLKKDIEDAKAVLQDYRNEWDYINSDLKGINSSLKESIGYLSGQNYELRQMTSSMKGIAGISDRLNDYRKGDIDLSKKELDSLSQKAKKHLEILNDLKQQNNLTTAQKRELEQALKLQNTFNQNLDETKELNEKITKNIGISGVAVKGLGGLFKKMGVDSTVVGSAVSDSEKAMRSAALSGGKWKTAVAGMGTLLKGIASSITPVLLLGLFIEGLAKADKETTELKKSMALTTIESMGFRTNLAVAAATSGDINITTSKLLETFSSINKQFGFISNFASETLVTATKLTQVVGIEATSANNLAAAAELNSINFETAYKSSIGTSYELQRQAGVQLDLQEILTESGKITGQIRANLGANPIALAAAITQAHLFGASLQDINAAGKAMLDFESSISDELQAELLLGRDINLEKARSAALNGDQIGLAKALNEQIGTYSDFANMNVLQQQSLAAAAGMTVDKLEEALFAQDLQGKSRRELVALGGEELANRIESQTLADKFNATIEKLKGIFTDVATAFMPVLGVLGAILSLVGLIIGAVGDLINLLSGNTSFTGIKKGWEGFSASSELAFGAGDVISPANGITQISTKEGGLFNLSPNDDIIAAPGIASRITQNERNTTNTTQVNMSETNMLLRQILTKQGTVQIDNTKIGTAMAINTYEIQ